MRFEKFGYISMLYNCVGSTLAWIILHIPLHYEFNEWLFCNYTRFWWIGIHKKSWHEYYRSSRVGIQMLTHIKLNFVQKALLYDVSFETLDEVNHKV